MISEVYDLEVLRNLFTYTGYCRQTKKYYQFVIWRGQNDLVELIEHLYRDKLIMIGYNNDNYDYPLLHHILNHYDEYKHLTGEEIAERLYKKSQQLISSDFNTVADWNKKILQIDVFKIFHYDNKAKATSLKALEIALNLPLVEDMPYDHTHWITNQSEVDEVLGYNKNDVFATNEFFEIALGNTDLPYYKGENKIELRQIVAKKYGFNCLNFNDIKLGTELILKLYCKKTGLPEKQVRKMRTYRDVINLGDCLPEWTSFKSKEFNSLVNKFKTINIYNGVTKKVFEYSLIYNGIKIDYGTGGAHACIKPGVYNSDDTYVILDLDIDSMYPNLAIQQGLYIEHLGPNFISVYDGDIVSVRMKEKQKPKKERDNLIMKGFKLAANGSYGKSNSEDSFLYDPLYAMKTTVSGQILISMWIERVCQQIDAQIIQVNTDGWTLRLKKSDVDKVFEISDQLMKETKMSYESAYYNKMVIRDVNNYSARYDYGDIKHKGAFEIDKELHKDPSMRIVPLALEKYFFEGIPISETIRNHNNIYDFCLRLKTNSGFTSRIEYFNNLRSYKSMPKDQVHTYLLLNGFKYNGESYLLGKNLLTQEEAYNRLYESHYPSIVNKQLSKNTRYYISNFGGNLFKDKKSQNSEGIDSTSGVNVGYLVTDFNTYIKKQMEDYDINYDFYINECQKIINLIEDKQLSLW